MVLKEIRNEKGKEKKKEPNLKEDLSQVEKKIILDNLFFIQSFVGM